MAMSITLAFLPAGTGACISGKFRQAGCVESNYSKRPRKYLGSSDVKGQHLLHYNRFSKIPRRKTLNYALGKEAEDSSISNVNEDTDEMFDELFNKYGKVVFSRTDQKSPIAEVDDDAESLSFAVEMAKVASDVKASDIKVLFVKPLVYWTRFFIIATAFSRPQVDAIRYKMRDLAEDKYGRVSSGDTKPNSWTLLDFGDVVVHIFLPEQRTFYNLEDFYGNATSIELPFENQPPFRG